MTGDLDSSYSDAGASPGLALWRVTNGWQRQIRAVLAPHDLTHVQYVLLASLTWMDRTEPVTQRQLAEHARIDVMMTSQVLRILESKGYITRDRHPTDGRAITLTPTAVGVALANRATHDVEAADSRYFAALSPTRRSELVLALRDLDAANAP